MKFMETKLRNIFTLYDFLGYFLPGAALIIMICVSHFMYDILLLFKLNNETVESTNALLFLMKQIAQNWVVWLVIGIVTTYLIGHIIAGLSSMILEKWLVGNVLHYPTNNMLIPKRGKNRTFWNIIMGYRGSMGNETVRIFRNIFEKRYGKEGKNLLDHDIFNVFSICFASMKENNSVTYERVMNYVSSYGFSRNASMAFLIAAIIGVILMFTKVHWFVICFYFVTMIIFSFFMFRQYLKFFRRVNDEVFFQFISDNWTLVNKEDK